MPLARVVMVVMVLGLGLGVDVRGHGNLRGPTADMWRSCYNITLPDVQAQSVGAIAGEPEP